MSKKTGDCWQNQDWQLGLGCILHFPMVLGRPHLCSHVSWRPHGKIWDRDIPKVSAPKLWRHWLRSRKRTSIVEKGRAPERGGKYLEICKYCHQKVALLQKSHRTCWGQQLLVKVRLKNPFTFVFSRPRQEPYEWDSLLIRMLWPCAHPFMVISLFFWIRGRWCADEGTGSL